MLKFKKVLGLVMVLVFAISVVGCGSTTVAEVNGEKITKSQLKKRVEKMKMAYEQQGASFEGEQGEMMLKAIEAQTVEQMINQLLVKQAAIKEGVAPTDSELDKRLEEVKSRFNSEQEFKDALKNYNYTEDELKEYIAEQAMMDALFEKVTKDVKVTEEEMKKYYDDNQDKFQEPEKVKARHILIRFDTASEKVGRTEEEAKKVAEGIIADIKGGADFAEVAKEKSEDEGSKAEGGMLGDPMGGEYFARGVMVQEFDDALFALKVGEMTKEPVKTQFGYHIIKLEDKQEAKKLTYEEAKETISLELPNTRKQEKFNKYIEDLKANAEIKNDYALDAPPAAPKDGGKGQELPPNHP